jgi:hypothetical protein
MTHAVFSGPFVMRPDDMPVSRLANPRPWVFLSSTSARAPAADFTKCALPAGAVGNPGLKMSGVLARMGTGVCLY